MESRTDSPSLKKSAIFSLGHFMTDIYPAFLPPLLPLLMDKFQLSYTRASFLGMILSFSSSLTQPVFGYLSDRYGGRKFMIMGPLVAGLAFSAIGLAWDYWAILALIVIGGLGGASYHPEAAVSAVSLAGRRRTLAMAFFSLGGNLGYGISPFFILAIVTLFGFEWTPLAALPGIGMAWLLHKKAPVLEKIPLPSSAEALPTGAAANLRLNRFLVLMAVVILRITTVVSLLTFLPTVQTLRGFSLVVAGSSFTIFMLCGAAGGMTGGFLADRIGRKPLIVASFILALPVFVAFLVLRGPFSFLPLALLGFLLFLSEPACIVLAQELAPHKTRIASSLVMGLAWGIGGLGLLGTGALADRLGIENTLVVLILLPAGALLSSLFLPKK
jgi:FSR family fosmidomycin resistance protein-like MFS transporter